MHRLPLVPAILCLVASIRAQTPSPSSAQCYYPDGALATDYPYAPCSSLADASCCIPSEGDVCLSTGLCWYPLKQYAYRGACTDRSWKAGACANYCLDTNPVDWERIVQCSPTSFCCNPPNSNDTSTFCCADTPQLFSVPQLSIFNSFGADPGVIPLTATGNISNTATLTFSVSTTARTTPSSSSPSLTPSPSSHPSSTISSGKKRTAIGVSVGGTAALVIIGIACLLFRRRIKALSSAERLSSQQDDPALAELADSRPAELSGPPPAELLGPPLSELAGPAPAELAVRATDIQDEKAAIDVTELAVRAAVTRDEKTAIDPAELAVRTAGIQDEKAAIDAAELAVRAAGTPDEKTATDPVELAARAAGIQDEKAAIDAAELAARAAGTQDEETATDPVELAARATGTQGEETATDPAELAVQAADVQDEKATAHAEK